MNKELKKLYTYILAYRWKPKHKYKPYWSYKYIDKDRSIFLYSIELWSYDKMYININLIKVGDLWK